MARERCLLKRRTLDDFSAAKPGPSLIDKHSKDISSKAHNVQGWLGSSNSHNSWKKKTDEKAQVSSQGVRSRDVCGMSDSQHVTQLGLPTARKRRVQAQVFFLLAKLPQNFCLRSMVKLMCCQFTTFKTIELFISFWPKWFLVFYFDTVQWLARVLLAKTAALDQTITETGRKGQKCNKWRRL